MLTWLFLVVAKVKAEMHNGGKHTTMGNLMAKMLNTCWAERDIGEVEVSHLLLQEPLVACTRQFETTSLGGGLTLNEQPQEGAGEKQAFLGPAKLEWYANRPMWFEDISMHDLMSQADKKHRLLPRNKWKVPHIIPWAGRRILGQPAKDESHARQRLLMHKPWRSPGDVVAGFERHVGHMHIAALEHYILRAHCPAVLKWEKRCAALDASRGDDYENESDDEADLTPDKEHDEWMEVINRQHDQDEDHGDTSWDFHAKANNWDWEAEVEAFKSINVDLEYLSSCLQAAKNEHGDEVRRAG